MKPSVTKLIEMLDKPALLKWANKIGLQGINIDDYRSGKKQDGTSMHETVENYLKFGLLSEDESLNERIKKFFSDKEVIDIEQTIETEYFQGRYDIKIKWQNLIFICDFKSSSKVYFETKLQLAAYKMGSECDHIGVIHLPELLIRPISIDFDLYRHFLIHLSALYEYKSKIENSK